ncbi:MAG: tyrosine-type recombinase/integrase [Nitrospiraceae bacterium]
MTQPLVELVEQFCLYQFKQRGRTKGGVGASRWVLEQFLRFVRRQMGRKARVTDLTTETIQGWMDDMAANDLALSTMRTRQATLSSLCGWLVKRDLLVSNPVAKLDRPPHRSEPPRQVPSASLMDALIDAARRRQRPRDMAIFLILRYSGMRRESVATLRLRHLDENWGLRGVTVKGGRTRDIPLPLAVMQFLWGYVEQVVSRLGIPVEAETPLFWSSWERRGTGKTRQPMTGKNIWRLAKVYGRMIGAPMLKPHDLRHGVAMEVYAQHHDLEEVRALGSRAHRYDANLRADSSAAVETHGGILRGTREPIAEHDDHGAKTGLRNIRKFLKPGRKIFNNFKVVVPTGFEPVSDPQRRFRQPFQCIASFSALNPQARLQAGCEE